MHDTNGPGVRELCPGLMTGCIWQLKELLSRKPHALAVLDALPPRIWKEGYRGQILYYPMEPYGVLPTAMLERLTQEILSLVKAGQQVALFSREDCGRISCVAACVLFELGIQEPVAFLKKNYSTAVPEARSQAFAIQTYCLRHGAKTGWHPAQMARHVQIRDLDAFQSDPDVIDAFWQIHDSLGEKARFLLRPSGMLPSVRVMVEAPSEQLCAMCLELFMGVLQEKGHFVQLLD